MHRINAKASWWDDEESSENPSHNEVDIKLGYEDDTLYIDGVSDDGRYLTISLKAIGEAIVEGAHDERPSSPSS
jgi:hypothetical protein